MKRFIRLFLLILFGLADPSSSLALSQAYGELVKNFKQLTEQAIQAWHIPGLAFAIVTPEEVLCLETYGVRKVGSQEKIDAHTLFRIGSLSKGLSAALSLKLAHKGIFQLHDPISQYLPEITIADKDLTNQIKIQHLLSHTNGIQSFHMEDIAYTKHTFQDLVSRLAQAEKIGRIGHHFQYQNVVFSLIQPIVERSTGETFAQNMEKEILLPLAMHQTVLTEQAYAQATNKAYPHQYQSGKHLPLITSSYYYNILAAGGIAASITDMGHWLQALLGGYPNILNHTQLATLFSPVVSVPLQHKRFNKHLWCKKRLLSAYYALGWFVYDYMGNLVVHHNGRLGGYNALMAFSPEKQIGLVILTNSDTRLPSALMAHFFDQLFGLQPIHWSQLLSKQQAPTPTKQPLQKLARIPKKSKQQKNKLLVNQ